VKINQQSFNKAAQTNAVHTGMTRQIKKDEGEVKTELRTQDKVSVGQYEENASHTGMSQDTGKKTTGNEEHRILDAHGKPFKHEGGIILDPTTGQPYDMGGGRIIDPATGKPVNMGDSPVIDPKTGLPANQTASPIIDPSTGQPVGQPQLPAVHPALQELLNSGHLSPEDLQKILELDKQRREEEQMVKQHEQNEREAMKTTWLNMWLEAQKAEKERIKTFMAYLDAIRTMDAEIAANRAATNKAINKAMNDALFG